MSTRRQDRRMRKDKYSRGFDYANRFFKLEVFVDQGKTIVLPEKLRRFIQQHIGLAWIKGYDSSKRDANRERSR